MENEPKKPIKGTWDRLGNDEANKISFDINIPETFTFMADTPKEIDSALSQGKGEVYYSFEVEQNGTAKILNTSAWTLLVELKKLSPLKGKEVTVTKKLDKGKQFFVVTEQHKD